MRSLCVVGVIAGLCLGAGLLNGSTAQEPAAKAAATENEAPKMETTTEKASYAIGTQIGAQFRRQGLTLDIKLVAAGIAATMNGGKSALSDAETQEVMGALQGEMQKKSAEKGVRNLEDGKKFLEANKSKEGVKVTKSGLQYQVLKEGAGATPTTDSTVATHYRGKLIDGTVFDNSYDGEAPTAADEPVSFGVTQVIKGWTEALQLMKAGSKYRLFIPSELAYGPNGPPSIGPNQVLVFDIELISVK